MSLLYTINPSKRRRGSKKARSRKHRSAAQRAATARMLAANRARRRGRSHPMAAHSNPRRRRRSVRHHARRIMRRFHRNPMKLPNMGGVTGMLKNGLIGGAGAVFVDIGMGYTSKVLPATLATPNNADGSANWGYVGVKTALALALGLFGRKVPVIGRAAGQMAEGALTVLSYQILRPMVPSAISLGYLNPAPTMRPQSGVGRYLSAYQNVKGARVPVRQVAAASRGANAAQVLSLVGAAK
jgi:hypothetical protein